jgi:hypothetical protein
VQRRRRVVAVGDESRTARTTVANMTRGEWARGVDHAYFCRSSNFGRTVDRSRKGRASSTQRRRWPRNLRLFLLSLLFLFCSPVLPLGGAAKPGKRREPLRRTVSDRGPWMGPVARRSPLKRGRGRDLCGCDHTSVNAPDPIRTPQLSALGLE